MLTLKLINERTEWVIKGLEKKHFSGAKEAIENVLATDKKRRRSANTIRHQFVGKQKLAAQIGALMKQEKKEEAESIKTEVARLKDTNKALQEAMDRHNKNSPPCSALSPISHTTSYRKATVRRTMW